MGVGLKRQNLMLFWLLSFLLLPAYAADNVWSVMRSQFSLNHAVNQPEVQTQLRWLIAHPSYLHKLARSKPYIYHIVTEVRKRNMPGEIALLPMLESAYDPFAYSGAGAAGLWQLMPGTGTTLGLKQDWWFDGRRSIRPSTDAALNYLHYLHHFFHGDWTLAIAAYDSGEGTVSRAIKNSGQSGTNINFWILPVPNETKAYVPRLLALAELIKYPDHYKMNLPDIPHVPYFEEVTIGSQIDLNHAAKLAGISYTDLIKLNPGYNRWTTAPNQPFKLLIPASKVASFNRNLSKLPEEKRVSWQKHTVRPHENLQRIARQYFTTPRLIRELNQLKSDTLRVNQVILIPSTKNAPTTAKRSVFPSRTKPIFTPKIYKTIHIVQANERLADIAKKYKLSATQILSWNHLQAGQALQKGQTLSLWRKSTPPQVHQVVAGDSLGQIAKRYHTNINTLTRLNPSLAHRVLQPGQRLLVG